MEKIKLVIWDLDETFWEGTLSEGSIKPIESNIQIVKELTSRGIMNSIVSKNDMENVKTQLLELGVWDFFVFPMVSWAPKGELVKSIINKFQFRPVNVLFLDDNHMNLEEVNFYNEGINVALPEYTLNLLQMPQFKGKLDSNLERLNDYKLLEKKDTFKSEFSSNIEFLRQSKIELKLDYNLLDKVERVAEMIERTNQLNYTKNRINLDQTSALLADKNFENFTVSARDRYGDYGIIGFVSYNIKLQKLEHFLFSCRVLNLGIEDYIFAKLGKPNIEVVGEVASQLNSFVNVDWIRENTNFSVEEKVNLGAKILFKGGCDLTGMFHYLGSYNFDFLNETNYVLNNNVPVHNEHSILVTKYPNLNESIKDLILTKIPFFDAGTFATKIFELESGIVVFSTLMDYTQNLYQHKSQNFIVPIGGYIQDLTDRKSHNKIIESYRKKGIEAVDNLFLEWFSDNFIFQGQIGEKEFKENLNLLLKNLKPKVRLIIINGAEVEVNFETEPDAFIRHRKMNLIVDEFLSLNANLGLVDLRKIVTKKSQLEGNLRHYDRGTYKAISKALLLEIERMFDGEVKQNRFKKIRMNLYRIKRKIINTIK
jgi:FkbH-like protein